MSLGYGSSHADGPMRLDWSDDGVANRSQRYTRRALKLLRGTEPSAQPPSLLPRAARALRPVARPDVSTRGIRLDVSARAARRLSAVPRGRDRTAPPAPDLAAQATYLEDQVKRHLEELRFSFDSEPLDDLEGYLICQDGCRAIVTAADLTPLRRLFLHLHLLGHLALGHVDDRHLHVGHEFRDRWRLSPDLQVREAAADDWVRALLSAPELSDTAPGGADPRRIARLRGTLRHLRLPSGYARACLQRLHTTLAQMPALTKALRREARASQIAPHRAARHG